MSSVRSSRPGGQVYAETVISVCRQKVLPVVHEGYGTSPLQGSEAGLTACDVLLDTTLAAFRFAHFAGLAICLNLA
jgi:hypothetical protein